MIDPKGLFRRQLALFSFLALFAVVLYFSTPDPYTINELYETGELQRYMEDRGHIILNSKQEAHDIYCLGFLDGSHSASSRGPSFLSELSEYNYAILNEKYAAFKEE